MNREELLGLSYAYEEDSILNEIVSACNLVLHKANYGYVREVAKRGDTSYLDSVRLKSNNIYNEDISKLIPRIEREYTRKLQSAYEDCICSIKIYKIEENLYRIKLMIIWG